VKGRLHLVLLGRACSSGACVTSLCGDRGGTCELSGEVTSLRVRSVRCLILTLSPVGACRHSSDGEGMRAVGEIEVVAAALVLSR
jgi:hypothetical protein